MIVTLTYNIMIGTYNVMIGTLQNMYRYFATPDNLKHTSVLIIIIVCRPWTEWWKRLLQIYAK